MFHSTLAHHDRGGIRPTTLVKEHKPYDVQRFSRRVDEARHGGAVVSRLDTLNLLPCTLVNGS
jgi:hypothetical protein